MYFSNFGFALACLMLQSAIGASKFQLVDKNVDDTEDEDLAKRLVAPITQRLLGIFIKSEGCDDPLTIGCGQASIIVNNVDHAKKRRGYNIVVLDSQTGNLIQTVFYDTYATATAPGAMAHFLGQHTGKRRIILVAIQDAASNKMTTADYQPLRNIGAVSPLHNFRSSFALIGWSGPGQVNFITQVQRTRYNGPSIISKVIYLPIY